MDGNIFQNLRMRLDHRWAGPRMSTYVDDGLSPRAMRRMAAHEQICPDCHRVLRTLREMIASIGRLPDPVEAVAPPSAERTAEQVLARIREQPEDQR